MGNNYRVKDFKTLEFLGNFLIFFDTFFWARPDGQSCGSQ